jgi:hypothetical protein
VPHAVEQMSFEELIHTLAMFEQDREPSDVDRAIHRTAVERRLLGILSEGNRAAERRTVIRVPGDLAVVLNMGGETIKGTIRDLGEGGIGVRTVMAPPVGASLDIELVPRRASALSHPPHAQAIVAWVRPVDRGHDVGLSFVGHDDAHRRRMRRLVFELLRRVAPPTH